MCIGRSETRDDHRQGLLDDWSFGVNPDATPDPSDPIDTVIKLL